MAEASEAQSSTGFIPASLARPVVLAALETASPAIRFAVVLGLFTIATAAIFWPFLVHLNTVLIGPPEDNMNDFWNTWYVLVAHDHVHFLSTTLLRFPEGTPLIYQSFAWSQISAVAVLSRIFGTDRDTLVALQNITILASFPLAGVGAFYLVRHLVRNTAGALIGGYIFAFNPSHVAHALHHAGVASIEFLPFFALTWLVALERRSLRCLGAAVVFFALSALSCWYYLFYCAWFIAFHLLYMRIREGSWPRGWPLAAATLCLAGTFAILAPLIVPMIVAARPSLYDGGGNTAVADLAAFIAFPPQHLLSAISRPLYTRFTGYPWEATVYLGLVNCAVLVWIFFRAGLARGSLNLYVLLGMIFFCTLAGGEALHVAGMATLLHLPDVFLDKLPFFANVRAPSRAIVFVYLFLGIGTGFAIAKILLDGGSLSRVVVGVLAALIALDFYPTGLEATPAACPKGLAVVSSNPERGFGVLDLPIGYTEENSYMLQQTCHGRPQMGGETSREMSQTLVNRLPFDDFNVQRAELRRAHVKYILIHRPKGGLYVWNGWLPPVAQFLRSYRAAYSGPDMIVLRVY